MTSIHIVDGQAERSRLLEQLLINEGYDVTSTRCSIEALEQARRSTPDVMIADLSIPVADGDALLREWRSDPILRLVPFVMYNSASTAWKGGQLELDLPQRAYLPTPSEPRTIVADVRKVLEVGQRSRRVGVSPPLDDVQMLESYSRTLVSKLEEKMAQLEATNRNLDLAQQVASIGSWEMEVPTMTVRWSDETFRIFGLEPGSVQPTLEQIFATFHPADLAAARTGLLDSMKTFAIHQFDHRLLLADGSVKHVVQRWQVFPDDHGLPVRAVGTCHDVTERTLRERELQRGAGLLRAVADSTPDSVFVKDLHGRYLMINAAGARFVQRSNEEVVGHDDHVLFEPEQARQLRAADEHVMRTDETVSTELRLTGAGGTRIFLSTKSPYRDGTGEVVGVVGIARDVTETRLLEAQVLRAQRLESIGTLAGGIAHDLNNVLAPIMMSIELLKLDEDDVGKRRMLDAIESSARRGADMVKQVLSFARGVEGRQVVLVVPDLLTEVAKIAVDTFPKDISIDIAAVPDVGRVRGDSTQLQQVLLNLCVNARDAMVHTGGHLSVIATNVEVDELQARTGVGKYAGPHVLIEVRDSGVGMEPDVIDRAFEPFFTTKELTHGTGLGLSTSLAIIASHGGTVNISSEVGVGTVVSVLLPATEGSAPFTNPNHPLQRGAGQLVLVVDDEDAIRKVTQQTLERFGYRVLEAANGDIATKIFATCGSQISAVITDMMMPVQDGPSLIRALQASEFRPQIIGVSGLVDAETIAVARELGVADFVSKPFTAETMLTVLHRALAAAPLTR